LVRLHEITRRQSRVRARFECIDPNVLTYDQFEKLSSELDINGFEYSRTHWSIKSLDLLEVLAGTGIATVSTEFSARPYVDLESHVFEVALSFPGEDRELVGDIASRLAQRLGVNACFYDFHYQAFLARPALDLLLQTIYRNAKLNVVFLSANYDRKQWCSGVEFRVIRDIIAKSEHNRVMFIRTGDGDVKGVFNTDGWIDSRKYSPSEIVSFIEQRAKANH
jgi:hypothetical protein